MVSSDLAKQMMVPCIIEEMAVSRRNIFHLDGPQALRHLDLVLELPGLNAVQWVYGGGQGPAGKWIDVYRKILDAGKSVEVLAADAADALSVLRAVGPRGVWLSVAQAFETASDVDAFLQDVERASARPGK
jgi:hypothetical protein